MKTLYEMRKSNKIFLAYKGNVLSPWWIFYADTAQKIILLRIQRYFLFCLFIFWRTLGSRHAPKSSSEFFWSTKCELEIFYVFGGKTSERSTTGTGNEKQRTLRKSRRICPRLRMTLLEHTDFCGGKFSLKEKNSTFHFFFLRFYFNL